MTWKIRLVNEYGQLCDRISKLVTFLDSNPGVSDAQLRLMNEQVNTMINYKQILEKRLTDLDLASLIRV